MKQKIYLLGLLYFLIMSLQAYSQTQTVCRGTTKTYSVDTADGATGTTGSTYDWTLTGPTNTAVITGNTTNSISIAWNTSPVGTYTLKVKEKTTATSCEGAEKSLTITVKENPVITASNIQFCAGLTQALTATLSSGTTGGTYAWTVPAGYSGAHPGNNNTFSTGSGGTYTVTYTDLTGCVSNTASPVAIAHPLPNAALSPTTGASTTICQGSSITLTAINGYSKYIFKRDGATMAMSLNNTYPAYDPGSWTVEVEDSNTCKSTTATPTVITVNPLPSFTIIAATDVEFCQGGSVTFNSSDTNASNVYEWTKSGVVVGTNSSQYAANADGVYKLKIKDANNCSAESSNTHTVNVRPNPNPVITHDTPVSFCEGGSVILKIADPGTNFTYAWSNSSGPIPAATTLSYSTSTNGIYSVTVVDTNFATNCTTTSATKTVVKNPLPTTSTITFN